MWVREEVDKKMKYIHLLKRQKGFISEEKDEKL